MEDRLEEASLEEFPHISVENVMNCSFSAWRTYCSAVTPNARVIRLSDEAFLYYLGQDGLILPPISSKYNEDSENNVEDAILNSVQDNASDCSFSDNSSGDIHINTSDCVAPFRSLDQEITCVIATLGGAVFPKLNWSAPKVLSSFLLTQLTCIRMLHGLHQRGLCAVQLLLMFIYCLRVRTISHMICIMLLMIVVRLVRHRIFNMNLY